MKLLLYKQRRKERETKPTSRSLDNPTRTAAPRAMFSDSLLAPLQSHFIRVELHQMMGLAQKRNILWSVEVEQKVPKGGAGCPSPSIILRGFTNTEGCPLMTDAWSRLWPFILPLFKMWYDSVESIIWCLSLVVFSSNGLLAYEEKKCSISGIDVDGVVLVLSFILPSQACSVWHD